MFELGRNPYLEAQEGDENFMLFFSMNGDFSYLKWLQRIESQIIEQKFRSVSR